MKKNLLLLIVLCAAIKGHTQSWAPLGAKWTYSVFYANGPQQEFREWICTGDTLLNGQLCQLIVRQGADVATDITDSLITYQDSNIVYWFNAGQFRMLYDFNKNAGESWTIVYDTCVVTVTVDSTSTININGNTLKVQHLAPSPFGFVNTRVIEGIGNTNQPMPDFHIPCGIGVIDMNYYLGLRCYEDSILGYYNFNISPTCNFITTGISEDMEQSNEAIVFPNPAADFLTVNAKPADIFIIYNAFGEVIFYKKLLDHKEIIQTSDYAQGLYYWELISDVRSKHNNFVIVK
jgi:hypothetical protein